MKIYNRVKWLITGLMFPVAEVFPEKAAEGTSAHPTCGDRSDGTLVACQCGIRHRGRCQGMIYRLDTVKISIS